MSERMPALFVGHGSPLNAIEDSGYSRTWEQLGQDLPHPKAILSISAHWYTHGSFVNDLEQPKTVYDMYGFPDALYEVTYSAPGSPELAHEILTLAPSPVKVDDSWGLDHGTWSILHRMYPQADIPTLQLSVDGDAKPDDLYSIGRALRPLRDEGVLIMGSGDVVHNLRRVDWSREDGYGWAVQFDDLMRDHILAGEHDAVIGYAAAGEIAQASVPTPDHFLPLLYILGAAHADDPIEVFNDSCTLGSISMTGYRFG